ncbi:MAG: kinase [Lachnospiraceae bacterium]|nr:kinase [Lachnospiraceae bacterium]
MRKLIILRGNSGSGKTTVAKELQNRFGANTMCISQDVIRRDILKVKDGENTLALPLMKELLVYGNRHCEIVILEGIMYADWYQPLFELAVQLYGTEIYAYYFDLPFEETLKRHQTKPNCHEFGEEAMRRWWREKDFSDVLKEVYITEEKERERIVSDICDAVLGKR